MFFLFYDYCVFSFRRGKMQEYQTFNMLIWISFIFYIFFLYVIFILYHPICGVCNAEIKWNVCWIDTFFFVTILFQLRSFCMCNVSICKEMFFILEWINDWLLNVRFTLFILRASSHEAKVHHHTENRNSRIIISFNFFRWTNSKRVSQLYGIKLLL